MQQAAVVGNARLTRGEARAHVTHGGIIRCAEFLPLGLVERRRTIEARRGLPFFRV
jgi:hypothetical protein